MARKKNRTEDMPTRQGLGIDKQDKANKMKAEIQELMELKGWTQKELAAVVGVSESTAWRWFEGIAIPIPAFQSLLRKLLTEARRNPKPVAHA